ncbi:MAG: glycosyltransferase family 2 protein [Gemmatimonadota bacterium]|nr:MAG: glycosyltransferase family 2 protein [Gemmatimonadota bacterium]
MSQGPASPDQDTRGNALDGESRRNFSVIIPAFNESLNIPELFRELRRTFQKHELDGEIILVDDGSSDHSAEVAAREGAGLSRFKLKRHRRNLGKTEALLTGVEASETDWIVLFDADLQHHPDDIPRLLDEAAKGYDIVCGRKIGKYHKRLVSGIYNWSSRRLFRVPVRDLNSIKIFRKSVLDDIHLRHDWHRFFVVIAHARGYRIGELDVALYPRRRGVSKYGGSGRVFIGLLDLVAVWFLLLFSRKPMLLFGFTGLALLTLGLLVGLAAIVMRLLGHGFRPLLNLVVLLGVMGVSLFGFGFVAELVATLRAEIDDLKGSIRKLNQRN